MTFNCMETATSTFEVNLSFNISLVLPDKKGRNKAESHVCQDMNAQIENSFEHFESV